MCLPSPVAQEFGMSQADPTMSSSQQPQQASSTVHILSLLLRLRQCCCHLSLLKKVHTHMLRPGLLVLSNLKAHTHKTAAQYIQALISFLSRSLIRLSTRRSCRATGSSCLWRSSSMLCRCPPAPRRQTPKTPWPLMALASPHSCLRTPVRAPRWAVVVLSTRILQSPPECENVSCRLFDISSTVPWQKTWLYQGCGH